MPFPVLDVSSAPALARPLLEGARKKFGFVPNLLGVLASSPAALRAYLSVSDALADSRLTAAEQQIVAIAVSAENGCGYCVAAHSAMAAMAKAPGQAVHAARSGDVATDARLEALRRFATVVVETRGRPETDEVSRFLVAGFDGGQILDVLTIVAMKTLSNYTNHLAETPLDESFAAQRWESPMPALAAGPVG
jgi:uncharacterized peroxidase-related enzyme